MLFRRGLSPGANSRLLEVLLVSVVALLLGVAVPLTHHRSTTPQVSQHPRLRPMKLERPIPFRIIPLGSNYAIGSVPTHVRRPRGQAFWYVSRMFHRWGNPHFSGSTVVAQGSVLVHPARDRLTSSSHHAHSTGPVELDASRGRSQTRHKTGLAAPRRPESSHLALGPLSSRGTWPNPYHLSPSDILMIAHLVQAEAGNQPFIGQVAVAAVVLNRMHSPEFPHTVAGVLFAPGQFETVSAGTYSNTPGPLALMAARAAAAGWDPTHGALYFYNPSLVRNSWMNTLPATATIGAQVFAR